MYSHHWPIKIKLSSLSINVWPKLLCLLVDRRRRKPHPHATWAPPSARNFSQCWPVPLRSLRTFLLPYVSPLRTTRHSPKPHVKIAKLSTWWKLCSITAKLQRTSSDGSQRANGGRVLRTALVPRKTATAKTSYTKVEAGGRKPQSESQATKSTIRDSWMRWYSRLLIKRDYQDKKQLVCSFQRATTNNS